MDTETVAKINKHTLDFTSHTNKCQDIADTMQVKQ